MRVSYEINNDNGILELPLEQVEDFHDINDCKILINTEHIDPEDLILYRTIYVLEVESDSLIGPEKIAYRPRVKPSDQSYPINEDDEWPIRINDILNMTVDHSIYVLDAIILKSNKSKLDIQNIEKYTDIITQNWSKQYIEKSNIVADLAWSEIIPNYVFPRRYKLPRNRLDIDRMALDDPDHKFL